MPQCTAKSKRSGVKCLSNYAMANGKCRMHGGVVKPGHGAPSGSGNAIKHGAYGKQLRPDDMPELPEKKDALGGLDSEILMARVQLSRVLKAQNHADGLENGLEVSETTTRDNSSEVKAKRIDYYAIVNTLLGRIESLEKSRKELLAEGMGDLKIVLIDAPDV